MNSELENKYFYIKKGKTFLNVNSQQTISQLRDIVKRENLSSKQKLELFIMNFHISKFFDPLEASIFYSIFNTNVIEIKDTRTLSKEHFKDRKR
jgi:hypothetical protein